VTPTEHLKCKLAIRTDGLLLIREESGDRREEEIEDGKGKWRKRR